MLSKQGREPDGGPRVWEGAGGARGKKVSESGALRLNGRRLGSSKWCQMANEDFTISKEEVRIREKRPLFPLL